MLFPCRRHLVGDLRMGQWLCCRVRAPVDVPVDECCTTLRDPQQCDA